MSDELGLSRITVPRGTPGLQGISLDMSDIYSAERRLSEVASVSPVTAPMLMGYFNEVCNTATKYLSWIEYEVLAAQKHLERAKATVILDKSITVFQSLKDQGIKYNEDFREALVVRDDEYSRQLDILNSLLAMKALLQGKVWSFIRAYNACKSIWERRDMTAALPNFSGTLDQTLDPAPDTADNFMGKSDFSSKKGFR